LHGVTPSAAREAGVSLKTFPPISFILSIRGVDGMNFRIEKKDSFMVAGIRSFLDASDDGMPTSMHTATLDKAMTESFIENIDSPIVSPICPGDFEGDIILFGPNDEVKFKIAVKPRPGLEHKADRLVTAIDFQQQSGKTVAQMGQIIDASDMESVSEEEAAQLAVIEQLGIGKKVPASTWVVFAFDSPMENATVAGAYARILTEWFPTSRYKRNEALPHMEVMPLGEDIGKRPWEIWMPVDITA